MTKSLTNKLNRIIVLFVMILAGMVYTQVAEAQRPGKSKLSMTKYRSAQSNSSRACYLLHKKRMTVPAHPLLASRRTKVKPMAETDAPRRLSSAN